MTAQTAVTLHAQGAAPMMGRDIGLRSTCAVQRFLSRKGRAHRVNGTRFLGLTPVHEIELRRVP